MKCAFLTETNYQGKYPLDFQNIRTEIAWQIALHAMHYNIHTFRTVKGYDVVFVIFPKATVKLNAVGIEMQTTGEDKDISIYSKPVIATLKANNGKVCIIQEGPANFFGNYDIETQFNFFNQLAEADIIFAHNEYDTHFYKGLFPHMNIATIPTLMIVNEDTCPFKWTPINRVMISGNFAPWYGGFQSYIVASEFQCPIYVPSSHCKRDKEEMAPNLNHLPWVFWTQWMEQLSYFSFAVSMMPTIAAGTFSANCAYYGIPCIGNEKVDTQINLFPELCVDVNDVYSARCLAQQLRNDKGFYISNSDQAKELFKSSVHGDVNKWRDHMNASLSVPSKE